jgi:hypothetical protein
MRRDTIFFTIRIFSEVINLLLRYHSSPRHSLTQNSPTIATNLPMRSPRIFRPNGNHRLPRFILCGGDIVLRSSDQHADRDLHKICKTILSQRCPEIMLTEVMDILSGTPVPFADQPDPNLPEMKQYPLLLGDESPVAEGGEIYENLESMPNEIILKILLYIPSIDTLLSCLYLGPRKVKANTRIVLRKLLCLNTSQWTPLELNNSILWYLYDPQLLQQVKHRERAVKNADLIFRKARERQANSTSAVNAWEYLLLSLRSET